jgi:hypothetical protein
MRLKKWHGVLSAILIPCTVIFAQEVGEVMWADDFDDDDPEAHYNVGWFYYGESDGLTNAVVEQRDSSLYLEQGSFQVLGVTLAGTNGVPYLETDETGDWTLETKNALIANNFSSPNQEVTFQVNFKSISYSWFIAPTRMIQDDDLTDSDPRESPSYLIFISPIEGAVNLAKTSQEPLAMLDPGQYEWLAGSAPFVFELDVFYWVKYYLFEGIFKVKVWKGESSDEPAAWLIEAVDPEPRVTGEFTYFALLNPDAAGKDVMLIDNVTLREVTGGGTAVAGFVNAPASYAMEQNFPNPFNPSTVIRYRIDKSADVSLTVYNQAGQMVQDLVKSRLQAGSHHAVWNGVNAAGVAQPSGVYYARFASDGMSQTIKMALLK